MTNAPPLSFEAPDPRPAPQPLMPVCPHCGQDPAKIAAILTRLGGMLMIVSFCENNSCRKVFAVFPYAPPPAPAQPPAPQLWTPR